MRRSLLRCWGCRFDRLLAIAGSEPLVLQLQQPMSTWHRCVLHSLGMVLFCNCMMVCLKHTFEWIGGVLIVYHCVFNRGYSCCYEGLSAHAAIHGIT